MLPVCRSALRFLFLPAHLAIALLVACGEGGPGPADGGGADASPDAVVPPDGSADGGTPDGGPPGCEPSQAPAPTVTTCPDDTLGPLDDGVCRVSGTGDATLLVGDVLLPGEVLRGGHVLVDSAGFIQCVGCDCSGAATGATRVECPDAVVSPGLINAHDHITFNRSPPAMMTPERYEHRHDWRQGKRGHTEIPSRAFSGQDTSAHIRWSELRQLVSGTTSINGSGGQTGLVRNLDRSNLLEGLAQPDVHYATFPLGDAQSGTQLTSSCDYGSGRDTADTATSVDAYAPHIAEGIDRASRNEFECSREGGLDLIQDSTAIVHGIGLLPADIGEMAADGTSLIWSPRSNVSLYGDTARVTTYARMGVPIGLGTDWTRSGSMNMLRELRCADELNASYMGGYFNDEQLWLMATRDAARVLAMDDAIGTIAEGLVADISIFDARSRTDHRAVLEAAPADVALVLRGGRVMFGETPVVEGLGATGCDAIDVCAASRQVCLDTDDTLASLAEANDQSYPLFFCDPPNDEPSCVPERNSMDTSFPGPEVDGSNRYTGALTGEDRDGDGLPDAMDRCQCTFDPIRPLDEGMQADFDGDGIGDACDPCPLDANSTDCTMGVPTDRDGDGVPNEEDNCPGTQNPDQEDADADGKGDPCDACPDVANPGALACPATVYAIKDGTFPPSSTVSLDDLIVTALAPIGFFVQADPNASSYDGEDDSGIFVYTGGEPTVSRGDRVRFASARVNEYSGQVQLDNADVEVAGSASVPPPIDVAATDVATGGSRAAALESVLVRVMDVTVTNTIPEWNEFEVDDSLLVDDFMHLVAPLPGAGEVYSSITGVLAFRNGDSKLHPRDSLDVAAGPPQLVALEPAPAVTYARVDSGSEPTFPGSLTVRLSRPVESATTVGISAAPSGLSVGDVVVPASADWAEVPVEATMEGSYTVTASLDGRMETATVEAIAEDAPVTLTDLTPESVTMAIGTTSTFTVMLDIPAPRPSGSVVMLSVDQGGTLPASVTVPADAIMADFDFLAGDSPDTASITAELGAVMLGATAMIVDTPGTGLVINEVDYDEFGTDVHEFIEIFNAGPTPVDLSDIALVLVNGNNDTEYLPMSELGRVRLDLSTAAASLDSLGYLVVGNAAVVGGLDVPTIEIEDSNVQNGNPDGVALVDTTSGTVLDALSYANGVSGDGITAAMIEGFSGTVSLVEGSPTRARESTDDGVARSLVRIPNGVDTDDASTDWQEGSPTPAAPND